MPKKVKKVRKLKEYEEKLPTVLCTIVDEYGAAFDSLLPCIEKMRKRENWVQTEFCTFSYQNKVIELIFHPLCGKYCRLEYIKRKGKGECVNKFSFQRKLTKLQANIYKELEELEHDDYEYYSSNKGDYHVELTTPSEDEWVYEGELRTLISRSPREIAEIFSFQGFGIPVPTGVQYGICFCTKSQEQANIVKDKIMSSTFYKHLTEKYFTPPTIEFWVSKNDHNEDSEEEY